MAFDRFVVASCMGGPYKVLNFKIYPDERTGTVHYKLYSDVRDELENAMDRAFKQCEIPTERPQNTVDTVKLFESLGASGLTSQFCDCHCDCSDQCSASADQCALKPPYFLYGMQMKARVPCL